MQSKELIFFSSLTLSFIFILSTVNDQLSKQGPWLFTCCETGCFWKSILGHGPLCLTAFFCCSLQFICVSGAVWSRRSPCPLSVGKAYMCNMLLFEQRGSSWFLGPCLVRSHNPLAVIALVFENNCANQLSKVMETPLQIFTPLNSLHRSQYSGVFFKQMQEYFPAEGPFLKGSFFVTLYPAVQYSNLWQK